MTKPTAGSEVFFAYPESPSLTAECMRTAAEKLRARSISASTWQDLLVDGGLVIERVLREIGAAKVVLAEISTMNANVLFEAGYAVAREKKVWFLIDESDSAALEHWKDFGLLTQVGRTNYEANSDTLLHKFMQARPDLEGSDSLWVELERRIHVPFDPRSIFVIPSPTNDDASRRFSSVLDRRRDLRRYVADEDDRGLAPLDWYVAQIHRSTAALVHLVAPNKVRSKQHNARASFLAGLAYGLDRPVQFLAPESVTAAFDYEDLFFNYPTARALEKRLDEWLDGLPQAGTRRAPRVRLDLEVPADFGEYVAEDERDALPEYFVETAEYRKVLSATSAVFIGRKGTGKTANMLRAAEELRQDRRNLVVTIKPSGYELEGLLDVINRLPDRRTTDYFLEGLWKFLLHSEIAVAAVREAEDKPAGIASGSDLDALQRLLSDLGIRVDDGVAARLERIVNTMRADLAEMPAGIGDLQDFLNQRLHVAVIHDLRLAIGRALSDRERVAILVDNLDKAWERGADYEGLSRMVFGLLTAVGKVASDYARETATKVKLNVTLVAFLRADIFSMVLKYAREPDKISLLQVRWEDPSLLLRVIEDRYVAAKGGAVEPTEMWDTLFGEETSGMSTKDYLLWRTLPRPRDLVYLCNAAVMSAVNARKSLVEASDIHEGERQYSQFAFEALLVESDPHEGLEDILYEFLGCSATLDADEVNALIESQPHAEPIFEIVASLLRANFLGVEVDYGQFEYPPDEAAERRTRVLTRRFEERSRRPARYRIHPAYRPFLEIRDDDLHA